MNSERDHADAEKMILFLPEEKIQLPFLLHVSCRDLSLGPLAPEQIDPARAFDRASRVLVQHESGKGLPFLYGVVFDDRLLRMNDPYRPFGEKLAVRGNGAARRKRYADVPDRGAHVDAEKNIAGVLVQHLKELFRMGPQIFPNGLQGHLVPGNSANIDQIFAEAPVGPPVLAVVEHTDDIAVSEVNLARALHLQRIDVKDVRAPEYFKVPPGKSFFLVYIFAGIVGNDLPAFKPAKYFIPGKAVAEQGKIDLDDVTRPFIERIFVDIIRVQPARKHGLVVAGEQHFSAPVRSDRAIEDKVFFDLFRFLIERESIVFYYQEKIPGRDDHVKGGHPFRPQGELGLRRKFVVILKALPHRFSQALELPIVPRRNRPPPRDGLKRVLRLRHRRMGAGGKKEKED